MMKCILPFLLLSLSAAEESGNHERVVHGSLSVPEIDTQSEETQCTLNGTCAASYDKSPILLELVEMQDMEKRLQFISDNGIEVEHSFMNDASERFLYIENYASTSELIAGEAGAETGFAQEDSFLQLDEKECPADFEAGPCYAIRNGNGQLFSMKFKDVPYVLFDNESTGDSWLEGILVFDASRFQRVLSYGLWVLEKSTSQTVAIRNVATKRRLFADKGDRFGGSPGAENELILDDQKWRHCVRYTHGMDSKVDCSVYI